MSALSDLFAGIAAAIRDKNGETGTMKPAQFPEKISALDVHSTTVKEGLQYNSGEFTPTNTSAVTINHRLGVVPDIVMVCATGLGESVSLTADSDVVMSAIAYSATAIEALQGKSYIYLTNGAEVTHAFPITQSGTDMDSLGAIRSATAETFRFGGSASWPLGVGVTYRWVAYGGVVTEAV